MNYLQLALCVMLAALLNGCVVSPEPAVGAGSRQIGNLVVRGVPEIPAALSARLGQYRNTRSANLYGWVGDDSRHIQSRRNGESQAINGSTSGNHDLLLIICTSLSFGRAQRSSKIIYDFHARRYTPGVVGITREDNVRASR